MIKHPHTRAERLRLKRARDTLDYKSEGLDHASRRKVLAEEAKREAAIRDQVIDQLE
jgi:hypothetical protein